MNLAGPHRPLPSDFHLVGHFLLLNRNAIQPGMNAFRHPAGDVLHHAIMLQRDPISRSPAILDTTDPTLS